MLRALDEYEIEGIKTTIPFHSLMLADERFVTGDYHTGTVEKEMDLSALASSPGPKAKPGERLSRGRATSRSRSTASASTIKVREQLDEVDAAKEAQASQEGRSPVAGGWARPSRLRCRGRS